MTDPITPPVSDRICKHMNEDHGDAVALYAKTFGNSPETESAIMESIDSQGMNLSATIDGQSIPVRIEFDHVLQDSEDAHHTLVKMLKQVRSS